MFYFQNVVIIPFILIFLTDSLPNCKGMNWSKMHISGNVHFQIIPLFEGFVQIASCIFRYYLKMAKEKLDVIYTILKQGSGLLNIRPVLQSNTLVLSTGGQLSALWILLESNLRVQNSTFSFSNSWTSPICLRVFSLNSLHCKLCWNSKQCCPEFSIRFLMFVSTLCNLVTALAVHIYSHWNRRLALATSFILGKVQTTYKFKFKYFC